MQGTKHETETIQCSMQTTHLETNTLVKQFFLVWLLIGENKNEMPLVTMLYSIIIYALAAFSQTQPWRTANDSIV